MTNSTPAHAPLPCPFCGGEAETDIMQPFRDYRTGVLLSQPAVYCTICSAQIAHYPDDVDLSRDETMALALTAWNTRADSHSELVDAARAAKMLMERIELTPANVWYVATDDPEATYSEAYQAVCDALAKAEARHG